MTTPTVQSCSLFLSWSIWVWIRNHCAQRSHSCASTFTAAALDNLNFNWKALHGRAWNIWFLQKPSLAHEEDKTILIQTPLLVSEPKTCWVCFPTQFDISVIFIVMLLWAMRKYRKRQLTFLVLHCFSNSECSKKQISLEFSGNYSAKTFFLQVQVFSWLFKVQWIVGRRDEPDFTII